MGDSDTVELGVPDVVIEGELVGLLLAVTEEVAEGVSEGEDVKVGVDVPVDDAVMELVPVGVEDRVELAD